MQRSDRSQYRSIAASQQAPGAGQDYRRFYLLKLYSLFVKFFGQSPIQPARSGRGFGQPEIEPQNSGHIFLSFDRGAIHGVFLFRRGGVTAGVFVSFRRAVLTSL